MSPERIAALVRWWVRRYTRDLPAGPARRRREELDADLHDHLAHERARGVSETLIALALLARMLRGLPADAAWRSHARSRKDVIKLRTPVSRSALRVALVTALVLLVPLVANLVTDGEGWSGFDFALAAVLLVTAGALVELALRRPRNLVARGLAAALGVAAVVLGEADDAPGLVGFGLVLVLGAAALSARTVLRRG
jgi:hypothetical protein